MSKPWHEEAAAWLGRTGGFVADDAYVLENLLRAALKEREELLQQAKALSEVLYG